MKRRDPSTPPLTAMVWRPSYRIVPSIFPPRGLFDAVADPADLDATLRKALEHAGPTLVDVLCQPLHEARAPVSEWVA